MTSSALVPEWVAPVLIGTMIAMIVGMVAAWSLRRWTDLSVFNVHVLSLLMLALCAGVLALGLAPAVVVLGPLTVGVLSASAVGRRLRLSDLGAGEALRQHEQSRRMVWQRASEERGRVRVRGQGELVRTVPWPEDVPFVPMTAEPNGPRLPRGEGHHVFVVGGSGSGKTTSAQRLAIARVLEDRSALLTIDAKGDPRDEVVLRNAAAIAGVPFVLFDPRDPTTDRWHALWGDVADVVARAVEPIKSTEPYYADHLRIHAGVVAAMLADAGLWSPSFALFANAVAPARFPDLMRLCDPTPERVEQAGWVKLADVRKAVDGGAARLRAVLGQAWRPVLSPRTTSTGETVAVRLVEALRERAVVLWRTYADDMPDEARAATVLALADVYAAAGRADAPWTLMLDEFGAVVQQAGERAVAVLQRGRSHHGQVIVITQSTADIDSLSQQPGLRDSMADNFRAFCLHRNVSPDSRDWLAKVTGTRMIWQSTDAMSAHGTVHSGRGSRRRAGEFRVTPDEFARLPDREAVIYCTYGQEAQRARILRANLPVGEPERIGDGQRHRCEVPVCPHLTVADVAAARVSAGVAPRRDVTLIGPPIRPAPEPARTDDSRRTMTCSPRRAMLTVALCAALAGCGTASTTTSRTATTGRSASQTSTTTAPPVRGPTGSAYVPAVFRYLSLAGARNASIDADCGPLLAHNLNDPGRACLNTIRGYQAFLEGAQQQLRLRDLTGVPSSVKEPASWLARAVATDLSAAARATAAIQSRDYLGFLNAWGAHAKAGRELQAAGAVFAAR